MGRFLFYRDLFEDMQVNPATILYGNGSGSAYSIVSQDYYGTTEKINLHSDTLKIFYDLGFIFFLVFFYKIAAQRNFYSSILIIYMSILFATDNILIYPEIMFIVLYISHQLNIEQALRHQ